MLNSWIQKIVAKDRYVFLLLFCAVILSYGNILFGDFVFDDNIFIENNVQIRDLSQVDSIYHSSTTAGSGLTNDNFYRPNQQFIYAVLYAIFGLNPFFFHLAPLLFHILNGFLLFILLTRLGISREGSFLGSLLFLLHPVLTQAVSYISGLSEPLVATTILCTLLLFLEIWKDIGYKKFHQILGLGILVFTIGLFSKENQVIAIPLMCLILILKWPKGQKERIMRALLFIGITIVLFLLYIYARINLLNFTGNIGLTGMQNLYTQNVWVRVSTFVHILPEYFKLLLFPWHLNYEKPYVAFQGYSNAQSSVSLIILISGALLSLISVFKKREVFFVGFLWFMAALLPVSGIIPVNSMYLEHWLYIPIIGFIFYLASRYDAWSGRTKKIAQIILFIILILFSIRIMMRNVEWGNPVKFYENELKYTQDSARIYSNLGMELSDKGDCQAAIPNYQKAIELADVYPQSHNNLAHCYEELGNLQDAANEYLKALYLEPNFSYSLAGLYNILVKAGDTRAPEFLKLIESKQSLTREDIQNALK